VWQPTIENTARINQDEPSSVEEGIGDGSEAVGVRKGRVKKKGGAGEEKEKVPL